MSVRRPYRFDHKAKRPQSVPSVGTGRFSFIRSIAERAVEEGKTIDRSVSQVTDEARCGVKQGVQTPRSRNHNKKSA